MSCSILATEKVLSVQLFDLVGVGLFFCGFFFGGGGEGVGWGGNP